MDQKDILARLREVNEQIDVQLEGKAPSKPQAQAQAPVPAAPAPDQTPAAVAPSAPAAGALTGVDPEAIAQTAFEPMKTDYKSYLEYELVADLSDPQAKDSYQDAESLPKLSMDYDAGADGGIGHAAGQKGNNAQKVLEGFRTSTTRPYEYSYKPGDLLAMTVKKKVVAVLKVKRNYKILGTTADGKAVLRDASSGARVEKPIREMAAAEGYDADGYAKKIYKLPSLQGATSPVSEQGTSKPLAAGSNPAGGAISFEESSATGYRERTIENVRGADVTLQFAVDYNSAGERLTSNTVSQLGKPSIRVDMNKPIDYAAIASKVAEISGGRPISINVAGNGIYTVKGKFSQQEFDAILEKALSEISKTTQITEVRSGGQTGADEAGVKAAAKLGIKARVLAPKGYKFRGINGVDVADESAFKSRFQGTTQENIPQSPAEAQGVVQTPPQGETPVSVAPRAISGESTIPAETPEKIATAATPVEPTSPRTWGAIARQARGERGDIPDTTIDRKIKKAIREFQSEPHTLYDRMYDLYVRAVDRGTGRLTSENFKAFDSITDPQHQNRGRQAVRASLLPLMLNYVKPSEDTPDMKELRREFYKILGEAGGVDEQTLTADKLRFGKDPIGTESINAQEAATRLRSSLKAVEDLYGQSKLRALLHPDHAQIVGYLAREIEATATELVDGTRAEFNPARAETYVQSKATEKNRALLTPADLELLGITDVTAADIHEMTNVNGVELTANQIARYRSEGSRGTRRYALDAAGIIDPRWQEVDERGLDIQEAFQNDKHPTADTSAAISFHLTSDATPGKNRNIIEEIKATKAMRAFMVSQLGEQVDIPGRIRGMALEADPSLRVARDVTSADSNPAIRLNRSMPYTRSAAVVYDAADKIRAELASRQMVMVRMGTADRRGEGVVVTSDNKIHYLDDVFAIFDATDGAARDLAQKTGGTVSQPFRVGEEIKYPGGVKAGDYDGIKFDVDPVVNQAVMHTIPLRKPWGGEYKLAYVPANLAEGMESKPVIDDNLRPSQFGPAKDAILTHVIADRGLYPEQGTMADGYIYGDAYGDLGPIYSEITKDEEQVRSLTPGEEEAAYQTMRTMEEEQIAGVRAADVTRPQPEEIEAMGKLRETGGQEMETVRTDLTPEEDKSRKIFDVKVRPRERYDAGNIYAEMDNSPASQIPNITKENPFRALRNPDVVEFDRPTPEETKQFRKIVGDMMFTLRYLANKSNWYRVGGQGVGSAMRRANLDLTGTKEILSIIKPMVGVLDAEGLADAEAESVYRKRVMPYFSGLGLDEEFAKTRLTKLPAQTPLRSSGRDGADMFLPKLPATGNQRVDDIDAFAYELYKEISREDALSRTGVTVDESIVTRPQAAVAGATLKVIKNAIERRIPAGKKRILAQELLIHNLSIEEVRNAAKPVEFKGTEQEWVKYVYKNGYEIIDIIREEGSAARSTAAKIEGVTRASKSAGMAKRLTAQDRATGIAKAYDYYTAHIAADLDGDSVIKVMNTALFGDELQSVIGRNFSETKSILMNELFMNRDTGEIVRPDIRGDGMRVVSDIEIKNMAARADSDAYPYLQFARNNDLKFAYDPKTGDVWLVKVKSFDKTGRITDIDSEWSPRGVSDFAPTAEEASAELRRNGGADLFDVVPVEGGSSWVLQAKKDGKYGGLMSLLFPPNITADRKMRNTQMRKALDAGIQVNFVKRALGKLDAAGVEVDLDRKTVDVREAIKGDKIGPFTYKPGIRPEYTFRIGDPRFGIRQRLAEVAETQLKAEEAQQPMVDPQLEAAREAGRIPSLQGERSPETGKMQELTFRPTGTRRLTLTPSERALMQRIRANGRLGGILGLAGAIGGTGLNVLTSGAKTEEEIASVAGPSAAIEAAGLISPALGAAANFGWTAANRGDMLRALVNFVGSVGGGLLGGAAGAIGGPVGSFAGGFAGSTLGATVTDSIYSSIAGNDGTNPAEVSYAPVGPATGVPLGVTPPTAALRKNLEEDPLKRLKEEFR